jgi:hypothetical protein
MSGINARPTGVTILAVLALIGGVFGLIAGLGLMMGGALLGGMMGGASGVALGGMAFIFGVLTIGLAIAELAFAYGAWTLKPWAWALGIIAALANLVLIAISAVLSGDIVSSLIGSVISIAIWAVVLYYLNQPTVKSAFGRA